MSKSTSTIRLRLLTLSGFALILASWLLYHHVEVNGSYSLGESFCDFSALFNCSSVAQSPYAEVLGFPIAGLAAIYYFLLLLILSFVAPRFPKSAKFWNGVWYLLALGLLPTLIMAGISIFVLNAVCSMCAGLYLIQILLAFLAYRNPLRRSVDSEDSFSLSACLSGVGGVLLSLTLLLFSIAVFLTPKVLVTYHFEPRKARLYAEENLGPILQKWKTAPVVEELRSSRDTDFTKGPKGAPLVLVEFSDFGCPFCARAATVLAEIHKKMPDSLEIVYKSFPLDSACNSLIPEGYGHKDSCKAAIAARCAGQQLPAKFWEAHDELFEMEAAFSTIEDSMPEMLALDSTAFTECMKSETPRNAVVSDIEIGLANDVRGTPTFYLNGRRLDIVNLQALGPFLQYFLTTQNSQ